MLHKTRGIVLNYLKYRETSIIAKIFTEAFGLQSYLVHSVRTKKPSMALFQPLMMVTLVVYHKKNVTLQRIAEIRCSLPTQGILGNIQKATLTLFIAELLLKVIQEEEKNEPLFHFLERTIIALDQQSQGYALFHVTLMLQLAYYLGFGIDTAQAIQQQLLQAGSQQAPTNQEVAWLNTLLQGSFTLHQPITQAMQRRLTTSLIQFYQLHIDTLTTIKSFTVLQELDIA